MIGIFDSGKRNKTMNILSIDFGLKHIGLAMADSRIKIAHPFGIIENRGAVYVLQELRKIIGEKDIKKIVVGRPVSLAGNITQQTSITDNFIKWLKSKISVPVEFFDERFTSKMAKSVTGKKNNAEGHDAAAAIFLQDYLDKLKIKG